MIETTNNHAADLAAVQSDAALSSWLSQEEVCRILQKSPRTINERIQRGDYQIERRDRPMKGRKPETCYNPGDVERIRADQEPKPAVFSPSSGVGPVTPAGGDLVKLVDRFADRTLSLVERLVDAKRDRGPWLNVKAAAARSGLSQAIVRRIMRRMLDRRHTELLLDRGLKIRQAALDELDAPAILELSDRAADQAEAQTERPMLVRAANAGG